jgi:ribonucleoside-diphosphate reductase alpha chain
MISAVFRRGGDIGFVVEELKAVFDPAGGRWVDGRYVPSLIAAIGETIEEHMRRIGFLRHEDGVAPRQLVAGSEAGAADEAIAVEPMTTKRVDISRTIRVPRACPTCGAAAFDRIEGCWVCRSCGYSKCS